MARMLSIKHNRYTIVNTIFKVSYVQNPEQNNSVKDNNLQFKGASDEVEQFGEVKKMQSEAKSRQSDEVRQKPIINKDNIGRNDACPCGSGKKFKKCHGV